MADTFNLDPNLASAFAAEVEKAKSATGVTRDYIAEINEILSSSAKSYEAIEQITTRLRLDPAFLATFKSVHGQAQSTGNALKEVVRQSGLSTRMAQKHTKELRIQQQMLKSMRAISAQLANESKRQAKAREVSDNKAAEKEQERTAQTAKEAKQQQYLLRQGRAVTDTLVKQAGLGGIIVTKNKGMELSLAGVLTKAVDVANQAEKIKAYNMMAAAQFQRGQKSIGAAATAASSLREEFTMSFEEAGGVVTQLTRAGVEASDLRGTTTATNKAMGKQRLLATDMVAVQHVYGRSVETQLSNIMDLRNNFGMYVSDAQKLDVLMSEIGAKIPGLSPEEAVQDIKKMSVGMRLFGANALDAATIYHTLMRDAVEFQTREKQSALAGGVLPTGDRINIKRGHLDLLGGTDAGAGGGIAGTARLLSMPLEEIKDFITFLSTAPANLPLDQELLLGGVTDRAKGHRPAEYFQDFRKTMKDAGPTSPVEFMKLLTNFFDKFMTHLPGPERQLAIESVLGKFNSLTMPIIKRLSGGFAEKEFNAGFYTRLERAIATTAKEQKKKDPAAQMDELLSTGKKIAKSLLTLEDWLSKKINDILIVPITWLRNSIDSLSDYFSGWFDSESEKEMKKNLKGAPPWVGKAFEALNKSAAPSAMNIPDLTAGKMSAEQYGQLKKDAPDLATYFKDSAAAKTWGRQQIRLAEENRRLLKKQVYADKLKTIEDMQQEKGFKDELNANRERDAANKAKAKKAKSLIKPNAAPVDAVEQVGGGVLSVAPLTP